MEIQDLKESAKNQKSKKKESDSENEDSDEVLG